MYEMTKGRVSLELPAEATANLQLIVKFSDPQLYSFPSHHSYRLV